MGALCLNASVFARYIIANALLDYFIRQGVDADTAGTMAFGWNDDAPLLQLLATFERETFAAGVEAAAVVCDEWLVEVYRGHFKQPWMANRIAAAIRNLTPAPPASEGLVEALNNPTPEMWEAAWDASEDYFVADDVSKRGLESALKAFVSAALSAIHPAIDAERVKDQAK